MKQEIEKLIEELKKPGMYSVVFDGSIPDYLSVFPGNRDRPDSSLYDV
jgi:hypothetical protein